MSVDVRLIAILDPPMLGGAVLDAARAAEAGGVTALQVRMKHSAAGAVLRWTDRLMAAVTVPVYVNDRADVAWAAGAAGVHLGADDLPAAVVAARSPATCRIGVSVGSPAEAARAAAGPADYWSVGSVYATASKRDAGPPIGVVGFRAVARAAPPGMPVIGIGGVTPERAVDLCRAGADGVAVVAAIFGVADPERAARALRDAVDAARPDARP